MVFENRAKCALVKYSILLLTKDMVLDDSWAQIGTIFILLNKQELKIGKERVTYLFLNAMRDNDIGGLGGLVIANNVLITNFKVHEL